MKNTLLSAILVAASLTIFAQDNKPGKGTVGIWYGVSFVPVTQSIYITGYVSDRVEIGGSVGVNYSHSSGSIFTPTNTYTNSGYVESQLEHRSSTTSASVSLVPMVLYHFKIKSNVDLGLGVDVPVAITTASKSTITDITTAPNYNSTTEVSSSNPAYISAGAGVVLSCKYFFYKNLAIGAMGNFGFTGSANHGSARQVATTSNSGSDNPQAGLNSTTTTDNKNASTGQAFQMLRNFNLNLSWYFGGKKKAAAPASL
ncbi:MAG: outer membrane beta-barrel protein [Bacteroidetes bacterium]|nr:outer membrane beta-barrel protein [Bacteroidota bacterium]